MTHLAKKSEERLRFLPEVCSLEDLIAKPKQLTISMFILQNRALYLEGFFLSVLSHRVSWMRPPEAEHRRECNSTSPGGQCGTEGKGMSGKVKVKQRVDFCHCPSRRWGGSIWTENQHLFIECLPQFWALGLQPWITSYRAWPWRGAEKRGRWNCSRGWFLRWTVSTQQICTCKSTWKRTSE